MERFRASPLASNLLHSPHRISLIPNLYRLCPRWYAPYTSGRQIMGREQLAQAGGPALPRRASGTAAIRPACSTYAALGSVISQILSRSASWSAITPRAMAPRVARALWLASSMASSPGNAG